MSRTARKRLIGLDAGDKRVGVAVSDLLGITAQAVVTLDRSPSSTFFKELVELAENYDAAAIVVGLPLKLDGTSSPQTHKVEVFLEELRKHVDIPVLTWDERFTTATAEAVLIESRKRRRERRKVIDSVAAQIMLQHYLDCHGLPDGDVLREEKRGSISGNEQT
jgi:putative Holliday junction resolvase